MSLFPSAITLDGRRLSRSPLRRPAPAAPGKHDTFSKHMGNSVYRPLQLTPSAPPLPIPAPPVPTLPDSAALAPSQALSRGSSPSYPEVIIQPAPETLVRLLLAAARSVGTVACGSAAPPLPARMRTLSGPVPGYTWPRVAVAARQPGFLPGARSGAGADAGNCQGAVRSHFSVWLAPAAGAISAGTGGSMEAASGGFEAEAEPMESLGSQGWLASRFGDGRSTSIQDRCCLRDSCAGHAVVCVLCVRAMHGT